MDHGTVVGQRYEIRELAGSGAMGTVYRALDLEAKRAVAIKVLSALGPSDIARFDREATVLSRLRHPNIVRYEGRGTTADGRPFLVLEWIDGETLGSRLGQVIPTLEESVSLVRAIASALAHAHEHGVVHRDIKPDNVLLTGTGFDSPRVLDFGVARVQSTASDMTRTGTALGTPVYMAPEQAKGRKDVDARADIYAVGCVLFECVTGQPPFEGDDVMGVLGKVLFEEPRRLSNLVPSVPDKLDELTARLLDKDPTRRPQTANDLLRQLDAIADDLRHAAAVQRWSSRPPRPLTSVEQSLVAVVAIAPKRDAAAHPDATLAADSVVPSQRLAIEVARLGGSFSPLVNGSSIAVFDADGSAADLAVRAAHCALSFRAQCTELPIALVLGRATTGRVPTGEVMNRVASLIRAGSVRESGAILLDETAAGLLQSRFEVTGKGAEFILESEREAPETSRTLSGRATPFVGRQRELRMLSDLFDESVGEPTASLATVIGPAGSGKSRLVAEWLATARGHAAEVWSGRGDPLSAGSPLGLVASALRSAAGIVRGDAIEDAQRKLRARIARALSGREADLTVTFLAELIGAPYPAECSEELRAARADSTLMGDQLRHHFESFVCAASSASPLVIVVDDAQWGDTASIRFIESALRKASAQPLFVLFVGRSDKASALEGLASVRGALRLTIGELPRRACTDYVAALLPHASDATRAAVVERAGGNAFFLEELVRFVQDGRDHDLPPTVLAMLQARLRSLPSPARRFLRGASIFGHAFWPDGVLHLIGETSSQESAPRSIAPEVAKESIEALVVEGLVEPRTPSRFPGKEELRFRQALVRDAAYAMLTDRDRSAGHRLAAEWLERAGEREAVVMAEHLQRGGSGGAASQWFGAAASAALDGHDFVGALGFVERGKAALGSDEQSESMGALLLVEAEAKRWSGDHPAAERAARNALDHLRPGSASWFQASGLLAATAGVRGDFGPVALWRERLAEGPCDAEAKAARLLALSAVGRRLFALGDYDAAGDLVETVQRDFAHARDELDARSEAEVHRLLGARARHRGEVQADVDCYEAAFAALERAGDTRGALNGLVSLGFSNIQLGRHGLAREQLESALDKARALGLPNVATRARQNLCLVLVAEGHAREAYELARAVAAEAATSGDERFEAWTLIYAAKIALELGELDAARAHVDVSLDRLAGTPPAYAGALAVKAHVSLRAGDALDADIQAREAGAILGAYDGIEEFEATVRLAEIRCALAVGEVPRATSLLHTALERLAARSSSIRDASTRESFLHAVAENAQLHALARVIDGTVRPPTTPAVEPRPSSRAIWSAAAFREDANAIVEQIARHLEAAIDERSPVTRGARSPQDVLASFDAVLGEEPALPLGDFVERLLAESPTQHTPRYVGHQVSAPIPRAALFSLIGAVLNNGMAAFEAGPVTTVLERRVIEFLLSFVEWQRTGGGVLTSGGSLGNLTALLAARQARAGFDVRSAGLASGRPLAILASEQVHYSITRAAQIMGIGADAVIPIRADDRYRMDPTAIEPAFALASSRGLHPIALVASAGATGTGSIDPLTPIADACERLGLWMHVDGAHGASALLSPTLRRDLAGIERAHSLVWDAHKLMSMPALATAVLFRDGKPSYETFSQEALYLFRGETDGRWFDIGLRTIECTKALISVPLYGTLATLGTAPIRDAIEHGYALARAFAEKLARAPDFELACPPDSNIVCFRHLAGEDLDERQRLVLEALRSDGTFYCVMTTLRKNVYLRTSLMNPLTTLDDLAALMDAIRRV
ncbi:MAG: protein kinase [Polyangiaceae bacterium]|nr:protein kinase [Polyangiaceae bacterium]